MKHGKNPTRRQSDLIKAKRLNPDNWLIIKDKSDAMVIVHRHGPKVREIRKEGQYD